MGHEKIPDGYNFNSEFDYVLAYSPSDCAWSITNKRFFYYIYPKEFKSKEEGINYFENNLKVFYEIELKIYNIHRPNFAKYKIYLHQDYPSEGVLFTLTEYDMKKYWGKDPHGYWRDCSNGWMCSVCERDSIYDIDICPHCGAIMDLKYEEEEE